MANDILITPGSASIQYSGSADENIELLVQSSGSLSWQGSGSGQLFNIEKGCDVYKIDVYEEGVITLNYDKGEFLEGDYIRICNFEGTTLECDTCLKNQYKIKEVHDNKLIIDAADIKEGLYVMNLSVQHSVHLSYH